MKLLGALVLLVAMSACSSTERPTGDAITVPWDRYSPQVRDRIGTEVDKGDCKAMEDEFDAADANDERQRAKYGEGNADLLDYLDAAMADAGCY